MASGLSLTGGRCFWLYWIAVFSSNLADARMNPTSTGVVDEKITLTGERTLSELSTVAPASYELSTDTQATAQAASSENYLFLPPSESSDEVSHGGEPLRSNTENEHFGERLHAAVAIGDVTLLSSVLNDVAAKRGLIFSSPDMQRDQHAIGPFGSDRSLETLAITRQDTDQFFRDFNKKDPQGRTPIENAVNLKQDECVLLFLQFHAQIVDVHSKLGENLERRNRPCEV